MGQNDETRTDAEVREEDQARTHGDAVERRAIGGGTVVRNRRAAPDASLPRAESRGIYRDLEGDRRVVGAGQVVPAGWERVESASVEDRIGAVPTVEETAAAAADEKPKPKAAPKPKAPAKAKAPAKTPAANAPASAGAAGATK